MLVATSAPASQRICPFESEFLEQPLHLPHVHAVRAAGQQLKIVVLRSPEKRGIKGWEFTDRLVHWLRESWGNKAIHATVLQEPKLDAAGWATHIPAILERYDPALLIWDVGHVDARRGTDLYEFSESVEDVIVTLSESRADLLLLEPEYQSEFALWVDSEPYMELLQQVVRGYPVVLFPRNRISREWLQDMNAFMQSNYSSDAHIRRRLNDCLGQVLATAIARAAERSEAIQAEEDAQQDWWE